MIIYKPFWDTLKRKGISTYRLIKYHNISNGTLYRIKKGQAISTVTIDDLCNILDCNVEDIISHEKFQV